MNHHQHIDPIYIDHERIAEDLKVMKENRRKTIGAIIIAVTVFFTVLYIVFETLLMIAEL